VNLREKRVAVTGGGGFLGSFVVEELQKRGSENVFVPRSKDHDLRDTSAIVRLFEASKPQVLIHLAAVVGGIGANRAHPGRFFYDSAIMGIQLIEYARRYGVEKLICIGTVCSYPKFTPVPFKEETLWAGYPEETNAPYGLAKKMLLVQLQAYRQEYDFPGIYLIPVNLYGPRDNFDLESSHVIPALIRKCVDAKKQGLSKINVWGTGRATREFLYVEDAAAAIVTAAEKYEKPDPINLGSGEEISIRELVHLIKDLVGYTGTVEWDHSKPDGQPRRSLDTSRAWEEFGWKSQTLLCEGLSRTIDWYTSR
jgi:GDP-L-fucose synthase